MEMKINIQHPQVDPKSAFLSTLWPTSAWLPEKKKFTHMVSGQSIQVETEETLTFGPRIREAMFHAGFISNPRYTHELNACEAWRFTDS